MYIYTIILQLYVKTYMISCMSASALVQALAGGCSDHVRQCMSQHRQHIPFGNVFWQADLLEVQIEAIRSEMDIEVNRLIAIIHKKNVDLTDLGDQTGQQAALGHCGAAEQERESHQTSGLAVVEVCMDGTWTSASLGIL